jgi:hypothetical protein
MKNKTKTTPQFTKVFLLILYNIWTHIFKRKLNPNYDRTKHIIFFV